jgi:subfamily B ATP-binding cassette protein MsbA
MRVQSDLARLFSLEHAMQTVAQVLGRPDLRDDGGSRPFSFTREIRFDRVSFTHTNGEGPTLSDVSMVLQKGEFVAVLGPSGAGKSTIANLLLRLLAPSAGDVLIDDVPIRQIDRAAWLSKVALTGQDADLLEGTLDENIRMGHPGVGDQDVRWALAVTGASEFVATLPEGLETRVGDRGVRFSGGQRQRLALARAIVGRPAVLVLDEATNAIHAVAEAAILRNLRAGLPSTTILVIAHRSAAVDIADRIVYITDGRVGDERIPRQAFRR